ncbi:MAG: hypothetical protein U0Z44_16775 [Kouleothrix sp.]
MHAAAILPGGCPDQLLFRTNMMPMLFNVLGPAGCWHQALRVDLEQSVLGYPFNYRPIVPRYLPLDEQHPHDPQDPYALSKSLGEQLVAATPHARGLAVISLRIVWAHTGHLQRDLPFWQNPAAGAANLWSYVDTRDCGRAARLALVGPAEGHHACFVSAADNMHAHPHRELVAAYMPGAPAGQRATGLWCAVRHSRRARAARLRAALRLGKLRFWHAPSWSRSSCY